jgi:hypothetical protein
MSKKIAIITLIHTCNENPCHLSNEGQAKWIEEQIKRTNLGWNWKILRIWVGDVKEE